MSSTVAGIDAPPREAPTSERQLRMRRVATAAAGPAIIIAGVLFALRGFAFHPLLTNEHPDILAFWLPRFAFLGRELSAGHIPLWNPNEMLGYRFAADPQSGWLYVPPMVLFSALSPGAAMRALIVFNPLLAGLGLFWFLRKEAMSRPVATVGGLCLAMLMSTSDMAISMPFAGFLAWTTIALAGASGYRQADRWSRRLAWLALAAFAWSQVAERAYEPRTGDVLAAADRVPGRHLDRLGAGRRARGVGRRGPDRTVPGHDAAREPGDLDPAAGVHRLSSLHRGYDALGQPVRSAANIQDRPIATNGVWAAWPLAFGSAPGAYAGAVDAARRPVRVARPRATCPRLGVRRMPRPHVAPHAERDRHGRLVPDAHAEGAVRRRVSPQPRADAVPVDDRDPRPGRGRPPGTARSADDRRACPAGSRRWRGAPARAAARRGRETGPVRTARRRDVRRRSGALLARDRPQALGDEGRRGRRGASSSRRAPCSRAVWRGHGLHRPRDGRASEPRPAGAALSPTLRGRLPAAHALRRHHPRPSTTDT